MSRPQSPTPLGQAPGSASRIDCQPLNWIGYWWPPSSITQEIGGSNSALSTANLRMGGVCLMVRGSRLTGCRYRRPRVDKAQSDDKWDRGYERHCGMCNRNTQRWPCNSTGCPMQTPRVDAVVNAEKATEDCIDDLVKLARDLEIELSARSHVAPTACTCDLREGLHAPSCPGYARDVGIAFDAKRYYTDFRNGMYGEGWQTDEATNHEHAEALWRRQSARRSTSLASGGRHGHPNGEQMNVLGRRMTTAATRRPVNPKAALRSPTTAPWTSAALRSASAVAVRSRRSNEAFAR